MFTGARDACANDGSTSTSSDGRAHIAIRGSETDDSAGCCTHRRLGRSARHSQYPGAIPHPRQRSAQTRRHAHDGACWGGG